MSKPARRTRSPHPGVVLKKRTLPSGAIAWRACFIDPDKGKEVRVTLKAEALPNHERRVDWAKRKSKELARRRMELELGAPRVLAGRAIDVAVRAYMEEAEVRLRARTVATYRVAFAKFEAWAKKEGVRTTADITGDRLSEFRRHLIVAPKKAAKRGGRQGQRKPTSAKCEAISINRDLASFKALVNYWRRSGLLRGVDRDVVKDTLAMLPVDRDPPDFLYPAQLRQLLEAALRHDAATFAETRAEHAGLRPRGSTRRHLPIAPFILHLLLSGCRKHEGLAIRWAVNVNLGAMRGDKVVGEIRLRAAQTKTHRGRVVRLSVSPALLGLHTVLHAHSESGGHYVFGGAEPYTDKMLEDARQRLMSDYKAPNFDYKTLRSTCATYLTNSYSIFGDATVFMSARQLGHSVAVAEKHYLNQYDGVPRDAETVEAAMEIEEVVHRVIAAVSGTAAPVIDIGTAPADESVRRAGVSSQP